ncbi:hypothetical protein [Burkholderia gladioli]|uniref:hypothetical protein n=1 Tax=Burkholderia gladioli TaxID=28095 RepID=UPI00163E0840|nr:hypothetical protein [Burkholderia gladioli]
MGFLPDDGFPSVKGWSKPVVVTWEWGYEEDPATKAVTTPDEKHSVQVNFPTGGRACP